jgi:hypothetical protein
MSNRKIEKLFPSLQDTKYNIASPRALEYNCIAWAVGETVTCWWPDRLNIGYWPPGVPREETLEAFIRAFETLGYTTCDVAEYRYEQGFEKIAIYADSSGKPTHASRQLRSGRWTSKLGSLEDIEYEFDAISGSQYGSVAVIMKRPKQDVNEWA